MPNFNRFLAGAHGALDALIDGWQRLYRRAAGSITRYTPGRKAREGGEGGALAERNAGWGILASEVFEDDEKLVIRVEAPGLDKSDIDIEITDGQLYVRGEKHHEEERREGRYHVTECAYGRFERIIPLPAEVDEDKARAWYDKGVLRIELPKLHSRRQGISVQVQ